MRMARRPDLSGASLREMKALDDSLLTPKAEERKGVQVPVTGAPVNEDVLGGIPEPVYDPAAQDDIQGNIVPGFNKDHQQMLFLRLGEVEPARQFLRWLLPLLASMEEVMAFRRLFRANRLKRGRQDGSLCSTWINVAFSHQGIASLTSREQADCFGDRSFCQGLAARSAYLGDPTAADHPGQAGNWVLGGPDNAADILIIVASDRPEDLQATSRRVQSRAEQHGLQLLYCQCGQTLPGDLRGHEHFGFKDGVSQPGVRGKLSQAPGDYLTPRYFANSDERRLFMAKPGQLLVWPGEFLLGEMRQNSEQLQNPDPEASNFPTWARRGSYLVVRRLIQDVAGFWSFAMTAAEKLGLEPTHFASTLIGRWPSGAPVSRFPQADSPEIEEDEFANNHFIFDDDARPALLRRIPGYPGDRFPQSRADFLARVCPHFAHVRKVNPRDSVSEMGKPADTLLRYMLRRGIPFGPPLAGVPAPSAELLGEERGLMFLAYGSSIEEKFEFVQRRWSNSPVQPNLSGHDPIIGQAGERFIDFPGPQGAVRIPLPANWVTPTGGGYFFAPTISAVASVLAGSA